MKRTSKLAHIENAETLRAGDVTTDAKGVKWEVVARDTADEHRAAGRDHLAKMMDEYDEAATISLKRVNGRRLHVAVLKQTSVGYAIIVKTVI